MIVSPYGHCFLMKKKNKKKQKTKNRNKKNKTKNSGAFIKTSFK